MRRGGNSPDHSDLLDYIEDMLTVDPRSIGTYVRNSSIGEMWVLESPPVRRLPRVRVLYEIDDGRGVVILWNYSPF